MIWKLLDSIQKSFFIKVANFSDHSQQKSSSKLKIEFQETVILVLEKDQIRQTQIGAIR